jgi:hypothetical protein
VQKTCDGVDRRALIGSWYAIALRDAGDEKRYQKAEAISASVLNLLGPDQAMAPDALRSAPIELECGSLIADGEQSHHSSVELYLRTSRSLPRAGDLTIRGLGAAVLGCDEPARDKFIEQLGTERRVLAKSSLERLRRSRRLEEHVPDRWEAGVRLALQT